MKSKSLSGERFITWKGRRFPIRTGISKPLAQSLVNNYAKYQGKYHYFLVNPKHQERPKARREGIEYYSSLMRDQKALIKANINIKDL